MRCTLLEGWTPFCLQNCLNSLLHRFKKVLETFLRDFGPYWHDSIMQLLQILLASGIKHFEQTVYFHVRHTEITYNPIYILITAVSKQVYCSVCGKSEKGQTEEQSTWVFTMPFLPVDYICKLKTSVFTTTFNYFYNF